MCAISPQLRDGCDGEADAADDEIGGHLVWSEGEELYGMVELDRAQDEAVAFKFREPEEQSIAYAHGEDGGLRRLVGDRRVVVTVDDRDGLGGQYGLHTGSLLPRDAYGHEAGPSAARGGAASAHLLEKAKRQLYQVEGCRVGRHRVVDGSAWYHNGNGSVGDAGSRLTRSGGHIFECEQIADSEHLSGEKTIETAKTEGASAAKKVGDMRGAKSRLASEESSIHAASIDPPKEFQAEALLQL